MTNTQQANTTRDRLGSEGKAGLNLLLAAATGGRCAMCGDYVTEGNAKDPKRRQVCHVKPALGGKREGWVSGNLFLGCGTCNDYMGSADWTAAVPAFAIPEGVIVWTDAEARAAGRGKGARVAVDDGHGAHRARLAAMLG